MTRRQALDRARELMVAKNIESAALEAELLLRYILEIDRAQLYTDLDLELTPRQEKSYHRSIERRLQGEPSAYITGHREFFGIDFFVDENVLIPRPETELLVEQTIIRSKNYAAPLIADIGTGCGTVAISLALNLPDSRIDAVDISGAALAVAKLNCRKHNVQDRVRLLVGNMLGPLPEPADIIVANLPYVRSAELPRVNTIGFEPPLALDGGRDGLDAIRAFCFQLREKIKPSGCLLMEIGVGQKEAVTDLLAGIFPTGHIEVIPDLNGIDRVVGLSLSQ
ncbi:MAG: peptide chain release factor N(5)-glutamine methyltransferase [Dehalococcoidales bacterium]|nr:peptide chain release factor N(5)-glutamine methyltransferase [Dehalococcoidales bacterium]